jgi:hypothetical protein
MQKLEDFEMLQAALDNDKNEAISNLTYSKIRRAINDILQPMQFKPGELKSLHYRLNGYRYIENDADIRVGAYVRWISLKTPDNLVLTNGAHVCSVYAADAADAGTVRIKCKTTHGNRCRFFVLNADENILFQKLTDQERIILDAFKFIEL